MPLWHRRLGGVDSQAGRPCHSLVAAEGSAGHCSDSLYSPCRKLGCRIVLPQAVDSPGVGEAVLGVAIRETHGPGRELAVPPPTAFSVQRCCTTSYSVQEPITQPFLQHPAVWAPASAQQPQDKPYFYICLKRRRFPPSS